MKIVLDTNVLISGLLSPSGPPGQIVQLLLAGNISVLHDARITLAYRSVLSCARFGFDQAAIGDLLDLVESEGEDIAAGPLQVRLPDDDDAKFLEVALAGGADHLVTGDLRHFPVRQRHGISVLSPAAFLDVIAMQS